MSAPFSDFRPISHRRPQVPADKPLLHPLNRHPPEGRRVLRREAAGKAVVAR
jgi:hypothetical protein